MKKRATALLLAMSLLLSLAGCGLFKKEYLSVTKYEDAAHADNSAAVDVADYAGIISAVQTIVRGHRTVGRLRFAGYGGTIQTDLTQACQEVRNQYALAAYAVNYISTDLTRVANYYEAVVYVSYRHTQSEIDAARYLPDKAGLPAALGETLSGLQTYAAFKLISPTVTADEVRAAAVSAFCSDPTSCVVQPELAVQIYPESGSLRFVEVELSYGWRTSELQKMKSTLLGRVSQLADGIGDAQGSKYARVVYELTVKNCAYEPESGAALGSTAYGALVDGGADSRGLALAYAALCAKGSIECHVVDGTLNGAAHSWNVVLLGGAYYHVDVSANAALGLNGAFMRTDSEMKAQGYVWDAAACPVCTTERTPADLAG